LKVESYHPPTRGIRGLEADFQLFRCCEDPKGDTMNDLLVILLVLGGYLALQYVILPRFGVPT
jgi:hypothetical protein